jgi:GDP-L-fucose synthase
LAGGAPRLRKQRRRWSRAVDSKRVLVTGGGGFLGSHLVERLEADGHDVLAARRRAYDLTHETEAVRMFDDAAPELVFHLAAEVGGIGANRANPGRYWYANLQMGVNVLEQVRRHEVEKLVIVGTVCSYPKYTPVPFREEDLWAGYPEETNAPYGIAKKALLVGAQSYREQYGLNTIFLLPTNLYGPRDNFHPTNAHVIPDLIRKMVDSPDEVVLWGDGSPTREFLYVDDCAEGLVLAAERYDGPEPVNLGAGKEISIRELAELVADVTGFEGRIVWDTSYPNGQPRRSVDATRARELFGFEAGTKLRDGLERTVAWYRASTPTYAGRS